MGLIKKILNLQGTAEDGTILNLRGVKNTLLKVADSLTGNIFSFRNRDKVELLNIKNDGIYTPNLIDTSNTSYKSLVIDENGKIQKKQTSIVATSGAYDDLTGKPTLFSGAYVDLTGKPNLFSGDYDDLLNLPTLFSGNYNSLTNKPDLSVLNDVVIEDSLNDFPSVGNDDFVYIAKNTGEMYRWNGSSYTQLTDQTAIWGQVSGTLSNQNDLQNALNGKADNSDVFSGNYNDLSNKPNLSIYVDKSSNETIGGLKTFTTGFQDNITNIGRNTSPYLDITSGNWSGRIGQSRFYNGISDLSPDNGGGWWTITGKRDWANGYAGIFIDYNDGKLSSGFNRIGGDPIWATMIDDKHDQTIGGEKTFTSNSIFNGNVGIGTNSPVSNFHVNKYNSTSSVPALGNAGLNASIGAYSFGTQFGTLSGGQGYIQQTRADGSSTSYDLYLQPRGGNVGIGTDTPSAKLHVNGNIKATGNVTAYSDERLKDNVEVIPNALDKINQIAGYTYTRNDLEDKEKRYSGVIAQEVLKVLPEVIEGSEGENYSVAYGNMIGLLIEGIKEQDKKITDLQSQINEIYKRI